MPIIRTVSKINNQSPNPKFQTNSPDKVGIPINRDNIQIPISKHNGFGKLVIGHWLLFGYCFLVIGVLSGCVRKDELSLARDSADKSQVYYQRATDRYTNLISKGKDLDRLRLELARLYFKHGDFNLAKDELKKTNIPEANKFLAITYYHLAAFTDALEMFNKITIDDDEYLFYHGLTCEKLNLFDQALGIYKKISARVPAAKERMDIIEKKANPSSIKELDPKVYEIVTNAPPQEQYPQAGALILLGDEKVEVTAQGSEIRTMHYIVKILNERGKDSFSEAKLSYDSTFERVELVYARTIKPDGTVIDVGSRHIRDVSEYLNFPLYSNSKVFIISFPEISEGAVIDYKLKLYNSKLFGDKDFVFNCPVQYSEPVMQRDFTVIAPKESGLHIKLVNAKYNDFSANLNPDVQVDEGSLVYSWHFKDIPQIISEPNMPPYVQVNPTLLISTFSSWKDVYNWWRELTANKIEADSAIKEKVAELIKDRSSEEEKARAIYNFCAQKIRYVAVEYGQAGYEPHYAADIFKNKYGDCKDQAILLVTMLKEAGIASSPVLISTKEYHNLGEDFPAVLFNHCIAALFLKDNVIFLDPTAQTCSFGDLPVSDQGRKVLIFKEDGFQIQDTPLFKAGHNLARQSILLKINNDESINAQKTISTFGFYDQAQRYRLLFTQPELIKQALESNIQGISIGAKLDGYNIENLQDLDTPVMLNYAFHGPEYLTPAGNLRIMPQLPEIDASLVAREARKYPIDLRAQDTKETEVEIELPKGFGVKYLPKSIIEDTPWFKFNAEYAFRFNKIYFSQRTELKKNAVLETEYDDFKRTFEALAKKIKQRIILEKAK